MRHLRFKTVLVIFLTLIAVLAIMPPEKKLKAGRDLKGGVNFVYQVDVTGDVQSRQAIMDRVKEVVKERLDPKGILDISVVQQGADRLEISMPLPSPEVRARSQKFEAELAKLGQASIDDVLFDRLIAMPASEREAEFRKLIGDDKARWESVNAAIAAFAKVQAAQGPYDQAAQELDTADKALREVKPDADEQTKELLRLGKVAAEQKVSQLADPLLDAEGEYRAAKTKALSAGVTIAEMQRVLRLRTDPISVPDPKDPKKKTLLESRRDAAIKTLKEQHKGSEGQIDAVIAAWNEYEQNRNTLNDPSDLIRLLKGAGVLNFRITVAPGELPTEQELRRQLRSYGPVGTRADQARWYRINKIESGTWLNSLKDVEDMKANAGTYFARRGFVGEELDGEYYLLCWDTKDKRLTERDGKKWVLTSAFQSRDQIGRPAISFQMDNVGGELLGELTGQNLQKHMAVVLDDEIYTAPTLEGRITTSGIIQGEFTQAEINYVIKVLSHGSMEGKLSKEPISVQVVAAEAGADNLRKGLTTGAVAFIICAGFMIVYYFSLGLLSVIALFLNAVFIVAAMVLLDSPFTLPGIAGVVLVFGQAIDANVLIYERMREEFQRGHDFKTAVRLGYDKALSSIIDGNVTTFIVCLVLGFTGTQEIKGFAITLGLGNAMTLFTQLFVTRIVFAWLVEKLGVWRRATMLPVAVPAIGRLFDLKIDWMRYRFFFISISVILTVGSIGFVIFQGSDMLGSEFRGGTKVTVRLRELPDGTRLKSTRAEVEQLVEQAADENPNDPTMTNLRAADIIVVNPDPNDQTKSSEFTIKTTDTRAKEVQIAVTHALASIIDAEPALNFKGSSGPASPEFIFPILEPELGKAIRRDSVKDPVPTFTGGAAIVLSDISPATSLQAINQRLAQFRRQPDYQELAAREQRVILLSGTPDAAREVAIVVKDPAKSYFDSPEQWRREVQDREWSLIQAALGEATTLSNVESFSPQIASTFRAQAIIAVLLSTVMVVIYVWVRFGSLRYSLAAILTTLHDCLVAVGAIALAQVLAHKMPGVAEPLGILSFNLDLNLVAAVLTILGFSLNDTIIVMDRIRETKGRLDHANRRIINESINKTISRTIITSGTTLFAVVALYGWGGEAVRGFSYAMLVGVFVGTYSSIAVAAPLVWSEKHEKAA